MMLTSPMPSFHRPDVYYRQILFYRNDLLSLDKESFDSLSAVEKVNVLYEYYCYLLFFPDEQIFQKFEALGIGKKYLSQFLSMERLVEAFDRIEEKYHIHVNRVKALEYIYLHRSTKALSDLMCWYERQGDATTSRAEVRAKIDRVIRNHRTYQPKKERALHFSEQSILAAFSLYRELFGGKKSRTILLNHLAGQPRKHYLREKLRECFTYEAEVGEDQFCAAVYDLLRLVSQEDCFEYSTKEEFEEYTEHRYAGWSFENYKRHTVSKWL